MMTISKRNRNPRTVDTDDTVDEVTKQECRVLAGFETTGHKIVRITAGTILLLFAVFLLGQCFKLPTEFGWRTETQNAPPVDPNKKSQFVGTTKIISCENNGWLHTYLFGESWKCSGEVTWNGPFRDTEHFTTVNWSKEGDDTGKTFSAVKKRKGRGGRKRYEVQKNDTTVEQYTGWFVPTMVISGIVTFLVTGVGLGRLIPYRSRLEIYDNERKKLRDRLIREGRIQPWDLPSWNRQETSPGG